MTNIIYLSDYRPPKRIVPVVVNYEHAREELKMRRKLEEWIRAVEDRPSDTEQTP